MRIGIVGAGGMGSVHARQYPRIEGVEVAIFDSNQERAEALASRSGAEVKGSLGELISWADAVDVCLPTPAHTPTALEVVRAKRHLFIEKPIARNLEDAFAIKAAVEAEGVTAMPGHVVRFFPEYAAAHRAIQSGAVGAPAAARLRRGGGMPGSPWFADHALSGGTLLDLAIHDFDWMRWTFGKVTQLYARSTAASTGTGPDYSLTTLTFENGCLGHVESTWMDPSGFRTTLEVAGNQGLLQHDSRQNQALRVVTTDGKVAGDNAIADEDDPYRLELGAFIHAARTGTPPPITLSDGIAAMAISLAALESAATGAVTRPAFG